MYRVKDHKTLYMFEPFAHLGEKRLKRMKASWSQIFREHVLPHLPVELLREYYHDREGRPSKELYSMMGAMILQQMHDLTDEETVEEFCFNLLWHNALNITNDSDSFSYVCPKSFWTMRQIMTENNLYSQLFDSVSKKMRDDFDVEFDKQRIDSVHICSNMRHLGRIGLFVETIKKFLRNLKRHHKTRYRKLPNELTDRYLTKQGETLFSMVRPSKSGRTLQRLGKDLFFLVEQYASDSDIAAMTSYQLLARLFKEQCIVEHDPEHDSREVRVKENKDVPSDSLQSHADPDAGYSGHKGKGYQVQVMETYSSDNQDKKLSLITHVEVESANESDANALLPAIEATRQRGMGPEEILADTLYGSDHNCEEAKKLGVEVIAPTMGKAASKEEITLADFIFTEKGKIEACPRHHAPIKTKTKGKRLTVSFKVEICSRCSALPDCPVKVGKKAYYLRFDTKAARLAQRRARENTPGFREKYRYRAGVEATMSFYDGKTGVKRLRVRGIKAVSFAATLKAIGVNIFRISAFKNRKNRPGMGLFSPFFRLMRRMRIVKDQITAACCNFAMLSEPRGRDFGCPRFSWC